MIDEISFEDILINRDLIANYVKKFFNFKKLSIYLSTCPSDYLYTQNCWVEFLKEQKQVIIHTFFHHTKEHVVLCFDLYEVEDVKSIAGHLPAIFNILFENLYLKKAQKLDPYLPAINLKVFLEKIASNIENISSHLMIGPKSLLVSDVEFSKGKFCVGSIKILSGNSIREKIGFEKWMAGIRQIVKTLNSSFPIDGTFFDLENHILFVLLNENLSSLQILFDKIKNKVTMDSFFYDYKDIKIDTLILYLIYPIDIPGYLLKKSYIDLSYEILIILKKGLEILKASPELNCTSTSIRNIIKQFGTIERLDSEYKVSLNIGEDFGVRHGQYFYVVDPITKNIKADVLICNSSRHNSTGEIIFKYNPFTEIKVGDQIKLIEDSDKIYKNNSNKTTLKDFFINIYKKVKEEDKFCIISLSCSNKHIKDIKKILHNNFSSIDIESFSIDKYIILLPKINIKEDDVIFNNLQKIANSNTLIGIINYPILDLNKFETIRLCIDIVEHASLLPNSKIAILDSITFNLRGDKFFIKGDIYSAIEEYKRAILLNKENHIAINSLGVCYAKIENAVDGLKMFEKASNICPTTIYLYNLGSICMKLKDFDRAEKIFLKCIELDKNHLFSRVRLSQLSEKKGDLNQAKKWLTSINPKEYPQIYTLLGNLYYKKGLHTEAKKHLESAIRINPKDATAIFLLGKIYIEDIKDQETGIQLIKKSISLRPDKILFKTYLNNALSMNKKEIK